MKRFAFAPSRILALAAVVISAVFLSTAAYTQAPLANSARKASDSTVDRLVLEYLDVVNSGDPENVRQFLTEHYDPSFLKRLPLFIHINIHMQSYYESAGLGYEFHSMQSSGKTGLSALVQNKLTGSWMNLRLPLAQTDPPRINRFAELKPSSAPPGVRSSGKLSDGEMIKRLEMCMARLVEGDDFSGAILLARGGKPLFNKAYGLASRADQASNRTDTKFNIASMGKMFTGVAVAQLAEQGKLSFDDPLDKYLPAEWLNPEVSRKIKIKHLLTHTSGLGDYFVKLRGQPKGVVFRSLEDYRPLVADESLSFEPGTRWSYSNTGMLLAGVVIEQATGESYFDYVRNHIYKPAGMTNTDAYDKDGPEPNKATGYIKIYTDKGVDWMSSTGERVMKGMPSGGSFSTVEDLLRFDIALRNHKLLSPEYTGIVLSTKPEISSPFYGYGFNISECDAGRIAEHGGDGTGIQSSFRMYLDSGYTVAVLANRSTPAASIVDNVIHQMMISR